MPTETQLSELVAGLSDDELLTRLRSGALTPLAADIVQRELLSRGATIELTLPAPATVAPHRTPSLPAPAQILRFAWTRVVCFPLRAAQGVDPLWAVFVFGSMLLVAVFKLTSIGMRRVLVTLHVQLGAMLLSYLLLAIYALTAVWLGVALWRTARRLSSRGAQLVVRIVAVLLVLNCTAGSIAAALLIHDRLEPRPPDGPSIMDSAP